MVRKIEEKGIRRGLVLVVPRCCKADKRRRRADLGQESCPWLKGTHGFASATYLN